MLTDVELWRLTGELVCACCSKQLTTFVVRDVDDLVYCSYECCDEEE